MIYNQTKYNNSWNTMKLTDLGSFNRGKSKHRPRNDEKLFDGGGYPLIQTGEIKESNLFVTKHKLEYNEFGLAQSKLWDKGTLCITIAANIAETAILAYPMCFPDSIVGFNANKDVCSELFMHYIFTYIKQSIQNSASGSIQDNINIDYLEKLDFKIPDKTIQDKIVNVLYNIDNKIEININIISELEKLLKIIYEYWFLQSDFPDSNGNPYKTSGGKMIWNEDLKREIPIDWKVQNLKENDFTEIINPGIEKFKNKKIYIATGDVNGNNINGGSNITYQKRESRANMQPIPNSVWFAKMKNSIKHIYVGKYSKSIIENNIFSTGFLGLKCLNEKYLEYIYCFINSNYFETKKDQLAHGATQEAVNNQDIKLIPLLIPNSKIIEKFHQITEGILKKININNEENNKLRELKEFLLPLLMNGQVTLKNK